MKTNIKRIILITLLIGIFVIIYGFSNQNGEKSSNVSEKVTILITKGIKYPINQETLIIIEKLIRKIAHFFLYACVGFLLMALINTYNFSKSSKIGISLILGIIYAISDEVHQIFIPGRSAQITDVLIDTVGVIFGIIVLLIIIKNGKKLYNIIKRVTDIILSVILMILLMPLFIVIAIIIKTTSKGPIIFKQIRLGKDGSKFKILKFRTMVEDADNFDKYFSKEQEKIYYKSFKLEDDPRVTKVGQLLRKTKLDELPQLWNIFKGELSFVGPRPIVEDEVKKYNQIEREMLFSVKPGLTGYWQVYNSSTIYQNRIDMEMFYVNNQSIWLDIKIFVKTIFVILDNMKNYKKASQDKKNML